MTKEEKDKFDAMLAELTKYERQFLSEQEMEPNEHGVYVYISENGHCRLSLDMFLTSYKEWLIENNIVKPL